MKTFCEKQNVYLYRKQARNRGNVMKVSEEISDNGFDSKLLEPGWGGDIKVEELRFIKEQLKQSRPLKRRWGFRPSAKRLSSMRIRRIAMYGKNSANNKVSASVKNKKEVK